MAAECPKSHVVEAPDGGDVASYWSNSHIVVAAPGSLCHHPFDKRPTDPLLPPSVCHHDGFHLTARAVVKEPSQSDDFIVDDSHPRAHSFWDLEVVVETRAGVVTADGLIAVDRSVMLGQLNPEAPTGLVVVLGVLADRHIHIRGR